AQVHLPFGLSAAASPRTSGLSALRAVARSGAELHRRLRQSCVRHRRIESCAALAMTLVSGSASLVALVRVPYPDDDASTPAGWNDAGASPPPDARAGAPPCPGRSGQPQPSGATCSDLPPGGRDCRCPAQDECTIVCTTQPCAITCEKNSTCEVTCSFCGQN